MVATAAIGAVIVGTLTLIASSHPWLNGLNALGTPGGVTFVVVGGAALVLIAFGARNLYERPIAGSDSRSKHNPSQESLITDPPDRSTKSEQKKSEELETQEPKQAAQPLPEFSAHTAEVYFSSNRKESFPLNSEDDVEPMVKEISDEIYLNHGSISIYFKGLYTLDTERKERMERYQNALSATNLQFSMPVCSSYLCVKAKPVTTEKLSDGKTQCTFANGIIETFIIEDNVLKGTRVFPDGKQEKGKFYSEGRFYSGYRIGTDKQIEFYNPESFASCRGDSEQSSLELCEVEGKLVVLEKTEDGYATSDVSIITILVKASDRSESRYQHGKSISKVLLHKDFESQLKPFIEFVLESDELGVPRLFGFSIAAILDIVEAGSKVHAIDPLKIIDPVSKRNIFLQAANWGNEKLLNMLIALFPQAFESVGQEVVAEFLLCGHSLIDSDKLMDKKSKYTSFYYDFLEKAKLDAYHVMWLQVAKREKPNENFEKEFAVLSSERQRTLYDAAYTYNNPYIYEPADLPVRADQYSINLMWINESEIPSEQEFLFGKGNSREQQQRDFQERFVTPVANWAKANPGSPINIWVDGERATAGATERSRQALEKALDGTSHGTVQFRDVRSINVVSENGAVFGSRMPIHFRMDLLKAVVADHVLRGKETKYFVSCNFGKKPLTGEQLFDKRTVDFLNDFGIVMAKGGHLGFENNFQILNGDNQNCMYSHRKVIIDLNIEMALERPSAIEGFQIYDTYPAMITFYLKRDGRYGELEDKVYDKDSPNQLGCFRYDRFHSAAHTTLPFKSPTPIRLSEVMPRKPV